MNSYKSLIVWQVADELALSVYDLSSKFPKEEIFGLTSQLRRASLSIVLNIVEGYARNNKNEFRQFLRISLGSLAETEYLLYFAEKRKYISQKDLESMSVLEEKCGKLLWGLLKAQGTAGKDKS